MRIERTKDKKGYCVLPEKGDENTIVQIDVRNHSAVLTRGPRLTRVTLEPLELAVQPEITVNRDMITHLARAHGLSIEPVEKSRPAERSTFGYSQADWMEALAPTYEYRVRDAAQTAAQAERNTLYPSFELAQNALDARLIDAVRVAMRLPEGALLKVQG